MTNKLSTMADKEKRLRKILVRIDKRGVLKHVRTLEEAHVVLVEDHTNPFKYVFYKKEEYQYVLTNGYEFPEERVYFLVATNPRNRRQVVQSVLSPRHGESNHWL